MYLVFYDNKKGGHITINNIDTIKESINNDEIEITFFDHLDEITKFIKKENISSIGIEY